MAGWLGSEERIRETVSEGRPHFLTLLPFIFRQQMETVY